MTNKDALKKEDGGKKGNLEKMIDNKERMHETNNEHETRKKKKWNSGILCSRRQNMTTQMLLTAGYMPWFTVKLRP